MAATLFLFQIGPVQAFIAQARRTQDLFAGSYILSQLASAGLERAHDEPGFAPIFPFMDGGAVRGGAPHKFAFLAESNPADLAGGIYDAIQERWIQSFAAPVYERLTRAVGRGAWQDTYERQASSWLEFYWAAVPYDAADHAGCFARVSRALAQRKFARQYAVVEEPGVKCSLTGCQSALEIDWDALRRAIGDRDAVRLRQNEKLGTLALIKRLAELPEDRPQIFSTSEIAQDAPGVERETLHRKDVSGYLAVLHMDGDQMGIRLSGLATLAEHQRFSRSLADYAQHGTTDVIERYGGSARTLVYAGGDDVLVLLPLRHALPCAAALRERFAQMTGGAASAGIAITPDDLPLDAALEMARKAEHSAKHEYGRDALVIVEAHGTGQMRQAGAHWEILPLLLDAQALFAQQVLSGKVGYELQMFDDHLYGNLAGARQAELMRLLRRRTRENASDAQRAQVEHLGQRMVEAIELHALLPSWSDMANWLILARFLAQGGRP